MTLRDLLPPEHVVLPLEADGLNAAVATLVDRLESVGAVRPSERLHQRITGEAARKVVGLGEDAVLPHFRTDAVDSLTLALGLSPRPIPVRPEAAAERAGRGSGAGSDEPASGPRLVALILAPAETTGLYLQATSTLARLLRTPGIVDRMVGQPDAEAVLALPEIADLRIEPSLMVRDVMAHRIASVTPDASVGRTLDLMLRRKVNAVPVVGEKGEVLGLVSESDIMRALLPMIPRAGAEETETARPPDERPVREIMTRSVLCVSEDLGVRELASMMLNKDVEQLPVVNAGSITGMVFRQDIIRKLFGRA